MSIITYTGLFVFAQFHVPLVQRLFALMYAIACQVRNLEPPGKHKLDKSLIR